MLFKPYAPRTFFDTDGEGGGGSATTPAPVAGTTPNPAETGEPAKVTFTPEQQQFVDMMIGEARLHGKKTAEADAADKERQRLADQERAEAEARGEFEQVKQSLITERDAIRTELDTVKEKVARYDELAKGQVESAKKGYPAEALVDFPTDADPLDQLTFLDQRQQFLAGLGIKFENGESKPPTPRVPATPTLQGDPAKEDAAARARLAASYRDF